MRLKPRRPRRQTVFVMVFLVVALAFATTLRLSVVRGRSMESTYENGDVVLVRRMNRFVRPLQRDDVVLVRQGGEVIIKRVYRLAGETLPEGFPYVLDITRLNHLLNRYQSRTVKTPQGSEVDYTVPPGYIVLLGDNLRNSSDSRFFGPVKLDSVLGLVVNAPPPPYSPPPTRVSRPRPR